MGTSAQPSARQCVSCGKEIANDANVCQYCGHDYRAPAVGPAPAKQSALPIVGGVLILIGALLEVLMGLAIVGSIGALDSFMLVDVEGIDAFQDIVTVCGIIWLVMGLIGILGGIFAITRKHFGLAILGGVFALPGFGVFALIGIILVAVARKEFK